MGFVGHHPREGSEQGGHSTSHSEVFLPSVLTAHPRGKQAGVGETPPAATRAELGLRVTQGQQDKVGE